MQLLWMAVANYLTALALNVVSPLGVVESIIATVSIVTFYTVLVSAPYVLSRGFL